MRRAPLPVELHELGDDEAERVGHALGILLGNKLGPIEAASELDLREEATCRC